MVNVCNTSSVMKDEISAAVLFLTRLINKNETLTKKQIETFRSCLYGLLTDRFKDHWFPEKPCKGQAYRCIRVNETERRDPILEQAAQKCGLNYDDLSLPIELTVWVDPHEVCCRFGEHKGSYCTVASFKNGNKENFVDKINIEELEKRAAEILRKATEMHRKRKAVRNHSSPKKNGFVCNSVSVPPPNILQQLPTLSPVQNFQTPVFLLSHTPTFQRAITMPPRFHFANQPPRPPAFYPRPMFHKGNMPPPPHPPPPPPHFFRPFGTQVHNSAMALNNLRCPNPAGKLERFHWPVHSPPKV